MNRFVRVAGTVLLALTISGVTADAWAQGGNGNGRGSRDPDTRQAQPRQPDADRKRDSRLSKEDRDQLRRDIRDHGQDVYRDRDRDRKGNGDRRQGRGDRSSR